MPKNRLACPYCGATEMCEHSYVDNSEPGAIGNEANIKFSEKPVRVCTCEYPGAWSIGLVPLRHGKIRDKLCPTHGRVMQENAALKGKA